jgi:hypothetical protein
MSVTLRGRRTAFDNIAAGSAITTRESTILSESTSVVEVYGGGTLTSTSTGEMNITNIAVDAGVSTSDAEFQGPENMTAAVDPIDENTGSSNVAGFVTNA